MSNVDSVWLEFQTEKGCAAALLVFAESELPMSGDELVGKKALYLPRQLLPQLGRHRYQELSGRPPQPEDTLGPIYKDPVRLKAWLKHVHRSNGQLRRRIREREARA